MFLTQMSGEGFALSTEWDCWAGGSLMWLLLGQQGR